MGARYKALRVTNPQGQQSSTYFLQLPYRYSLPLLITSILLHWVLSGCIYLLVMQGEYFFSSGHDGPFGSVMAVGYSMKSLFTMMMLSIFLALIPPLLGCIALPLNTVVVGSSSLAIAAACQVSPLVGQHQVQPRKAYHECMVDPHNGEIQLQDIMESSSRLLARDEQPLEPRNDDEEQTATLLRVSQSKIRWGVVDMPPSWEEQYNRQDIIVEHISFGLPEDDVQQPIAGHWYA